MSLIKRFVPFFLAFVLGLFVASFFVSVGFPKFNKYERRGYYRHSEYNCRMRYELERQRLENQRLRDELLAPNVENPTPPVAPMNRVR